MRVVNNYPIPGEHVVYNMDDDRDLAAFQRRSTMPPSYREVLPRDWDAKPLGSFTDGKVAGDFMGPEGPIDLVPWGDIHDAIDEAWELETWPINHFQRALGESFKWNQNGLGYCWTWGYCAAYMALRAALGMKTVLFPPVANGYLVGWANRGNYLESMIRGGTDNGLIPCQGGEYPGQDGWPSVNVNSTSRDSRFWGQYDGLRKDFRLFESWEVNTRSGEQRNIQESLSCMRCGIPGYIAHNYWSHALTHMCMVNDPAAQWGITIGHFNSHNDGLIFLEGSRATADEFIALVKVGAGEVE